MTKDEIVLFSIFERTAIKKKFCSLTNISKNIAKYHEFQNPNKEKTKEEILKIVGKYLENGIVTLDYNESAFNDKDLLCFCIADEHGAEISEQYRKNTQERFDSLNDDAKNILFDIYYKQFTEIEPYDLSELSPEERERFDKNLSALNDAAFVTVKNSFIKDSCQLLCTNAVLTIAARIVCENNTRPTYEKTNSRSGE